MPPAPDGIPWLAWAVVVVLLALIGGIPALVTALYTRRDTKHEIGKAKGVIDEVREQVANSHDTNLRADIDESKAASRGALDQATLAAESAHRVERHVEDLVRTIRALEHSADRRDQIATRALTEVREDLDAHLDEIPAILDKAFTDHCPRLHSKELEKRP